MVPFVFRKTISRFLLLNVYLCNVVIYRAKGMVAKKRQAAFKCMFVVNQFDVCKAD